jgi:hypothetical protein
LGENLPEDTYSQLLQEFDKNHDNKVFFCLINEDFQTGVHTHDEEFVEE